MAQLILPDSQKIVVSRPDGRPEVYDVKAGLTFHCEFCAAQGLPSGFQKGEIVMTNPVDSPDGQMHFLHVSYLPDDVVIYDPETDMCRDKSGQNTWRES